MLRADLKEALQKLQRNRENVRNICILAHVDHGKTTLADSLIASNGIISQRQAGKLRYLDSREDEQLRGITMKSSAIALQFAKGRQEYLVNLIDSPGHVDFSSEVSTAVRLCDGALVVVDAVEGVCAQTKVVLQQAWVEGIKPCLVINKIDRLIVELRQTPTEAYYHLQNLLEQVNAVMASLFTTKFLEDAAGKTEDGSKDSGPGSLPGDGGGKEVEDKEEEVVYNWSAGLEETDDSSLYFSPELGNVIFASALDGWGFGVNHFAELYAKKLGIRAEILRRTLWGDFFLNAKAKRIFKGAQAKAKKPLFVQFVLENMWAVYDAVVLHRDKERIEKIVRSMNLKVSARDARHADSKVHLSAICRQWLPLATAVLEMVVEHLPSPLQLVPERVEKLMCSIAETFDSFPPQTQRLKVDFLMCSPDSTAPTIVFVSKLFAMDPTALPQNRSRPLTQEEIAQRRAAARQRLLARSEAAEETSPEQQQYSTKVGVADTGASDGEKEAGDEDGEQEVDKVMFLAFSRVYSGTIRKGQRLYVLQPRYNPREVQLEGGVAGSEGGGATPSLPPHVSQFTVEDLYILMGREVLPVDEVPAGNVLGISRLEDHILKSATVTSSLACPAFRPLTLAAAPIVRVAIEPVHASDMPALVQGMKLLNMADPCVEVFAQETGEHTLSTAGEVHLKKCLDDLRDTYARVPLSISAPIVPFRETLIPPPKLDMVNEVISSENEIRVPSSLLTESNQEQGEEATEGVVTVQTANRMCTLLIQALPLPTAVTKLLEENTHLLKALNLSGVGSSRDEVRLSEEMIEQLGELKKKLKEGFTISESEDDRTDSFDWQAAVDKIWSFGPRHTGPNVLLNAVPSYSRPSVWTALGEDSCSRLSLREYDNSIISGFQLATLSGPLCEEPMHGVCLVVREWTNGSRNGRVAGRDTSSHQQDTGSLGTASSAAVVPAKGDGGLDVCPGERESTPSMAQPRTQASDIYGPFSGQLISAVKEGCRRAFLAQPTRLMAAMYSCNILATAEVLGRLYGVLGRRNGRVVAEEMVEGSTVFNVQALVPVAESFGFAEEVRKKTSGLASPQLIFSHWEVIPNDPFWVPSTEEELLHFGEKADSENLARRYMNAVRRRKGLPVEEKIVEFAEKQRTLKKNK